MIPLKLSNRTTIGFGTADSSTKEHVTFIVIFVVVRTVGEQAISVAGLVARAVLIRLNTVSIGIVFVELVLSARRRCSWWWQADRGRRARS